MTNQWRPEMVEWNGPKGWRGLFQPAVNAKRAFVGNWRHRKWEKIWIPMKFYLFFLFLIVITLINLSSLDIKVPSFKLHIRSLTVSASSSSPNLGHLTPNLTRNKFAAFSNVSIISNWSRSVTFFRSKITRISIGLPLREFESVWGGVLISLWMWEFGKGMGRSIAARKELRECWALGMWK